MFVTSQVARFLKETAGGEGARGRHTSSRSGRSRSRSERRRSRGKSGKSSRRSRSKERKSSSSKMKVKERSRSKSKNNKKTKKDRSSSRSKSSEGRKRKSGSGGRKSRKSGSSERVSGKEDMLDDDEFAKRLDKQLSGSSLRKQEESKGGWQAVEGVEREQKKEKEMPQSKAPIINVFGSDDETEGKKTKTKVPSGGMWVPTGADSILEGVKEAKSRLQEKEKGGRRRDEKWEEEHRRRKTELPPPPPPDYEVTFDSRTGMYIRVPKKGKGDTTAEKVAMAKTTEMDKEGEERVIRKVETSPPRLPKKRSRSRSRERRSGRSGSRERRRSRGRRSRERRSRSRSRGKRSRSRERGRRRSKSGERKKQVSSLQKEVMGK